MCGQRPAESSERESRTTAKPLAEPKQPALQPIDSTAEAARAKARLAMLEALAPAAQKPELKSALESSRDEVKQEIESLPATPRRGLQAVELPKLDPLGSPASTLAPVNPVEDDEPAPKPTPNGN